MNKKYHIRIDQLRRDSQVALIYMPKKITGEKIEFYDNYNEAQKQATLLAANLARDGYTAYHGCYTHNEIIHVAVALLSGPVTFVVDEE